ncbi:hypothetical protein [Micromonospora sp. MW-13]|uniref:hypothetical protein n=1 Tax=Micromonospora sp. MW-13 TaxID=2094022 RepID=UPI000FFF28AF|nr:hypothetical protein [Micromonospora sp. MW-13]
MSSSLPPLPNEDHHPYLWPPPPPRSEGPYPYPPPPPPPSEGPPSRAYPAGIDDAAVLTAAVVWVGGAVGAGVLGNAAYDLFKAAVSRLLRRSSPKILSQPQAVQIARKALRERLMQAEIDDFPEDEELQVDQWSLSERGWWIVLQGLDVRAYVTIPAASERKDAIEAEVKVSLSNRARLPADLG